MSLHSDNCAAKIIINLNTMNVSKMLNYKSLVQTLIQTTEDNVVDDVVTSVSLVATSVFQLFINTKPSSVIKKMVRVETKSDSNKRKVIYYAKDMDCSRTLELLSGIEVQEIRDIGAEFFYITARKFSKTQSIDNYAIFVSYLFTAFGFDSQFIKSFFSVNRSGEEVCNFLDHASQWSFEKSEELVARSVFSCLDKLSQMGHTEDLIHVLKRFNLVVKSSDFFQKQMQKLLLNSVYNIINIGCSKESLEEILEIFHELGYEYTLFICNKLLDIMNKNLKNNGFTDIILGFMSKHNLEANIITYNTIMDYYCISGRFDTAFEIYKSLPERQVSPDSFTFSILIKGVKSMEKHDVEAAFELFEQYKKQTAIKDIILYNNIIDVLISNRHVDRVEAVLRDIEQTEGLSADTITFNILIKGCCKNKDFANGYDYFMKMRAVGFKPNKICYNNLMDLAIKVGQMEKALKVLESMQKDEVAPDGFTYSIILNGLKINNSPIQLIENSLKKLQEVIEGNTFKLDEVFFNSIFDLCAKYDLNDFLEYFYNIMKTKKIPESGVTYGILLKAHCKSNDYNMAIKILEQMLDSGITINEVTYGSVLDACTKSGNMELSMHLYSILRKTHTNLSSIVFTTLLSGFIKAEKYQEGIEFFKSIKSHTHLNGMLITYNCALDAYVRMNNMDKAYDLFNEIESVFKADVISYSTIIKGLCQSEKKKEALECMKSMITNLPEVDVSVVNLLLDSCSTPNDFRLAVQGYQYAMMKNIAPNEITFGIMVKVYGFSRELQKAFDLLDLMAVYEIQPSIIIYTNLVHISFYNKSPKKAEIAFTLFKRAGLRGDRLLYSKLITGLCKFKDSQKVDKYLDYAIADGCGLKPDCIEFLYDIFEGDDYILDKIALIEEIGKKEKKTSYAASNAERFKSKNNVKAKHSRPTVVQERQPKVNEASNDDNKRSFKNYDNIKSQQAPMKPTKDTAFSSNNTDGAKKPLSLFNFRQKKTN